MIFVSVLDIIMPKSNYAKLIKFFISLIIVVNILSIFRSVNIFNIDNLFMKQDTVEINESYKYVEESISEEISKDIKRIISGNYTYNIQSINTDIIFRNYYDFDIREIEVIVQTNEDIVGKQKIEDNIKNLIFDAYSNNVSNIIVQYTI